MKEGPGSPTLNALLTSSETLAHPRGLVRICSVLFCSVLLFCSLVLFCSVLFCSVLSLSISLSLSFSLSLSLSLSVSVSFFLSLSLYIYTYKYKSKITVPICFVPMGQKNKGDLMQNSDAITILNCAVDNH